MSADSFRAELYGDTKFTDLILICEGRSFPVHRAVICSDSAYIEKLCSSAPKDSDSRIVAVKECDALTIYRVIKYLYMGHYESGDEEIFLPEGRPDFATKPPSTSNVWSMLDLVDTKPVNFLEGLFGDIGVDCPIPTVQPLSPTDHANSLPLIDIGDTNSLSQLTRVVDLEAEFSCVHKTPQIARAWNHLKVYNAAEHFQIRDLTKESLLRLTDQVHDSCSSEGFVDLAEFTFRVFQQKSETALPCRLIAEECGKNIFLLLDDPRFHEILRDVNCLAYLTLVSLVETARSTYEDVAAQREAFGSVEGVEIPQRLYTDNASVADDTGLHEAKSSPEFNTNSLTDRVAPDPRSITMATGSASRRGFTPARDPANLQNMFTKALRSQANRHVNHPVEERHQYPHQDIESVVGSVTDSVKAMSLGTVAQEDQVQHIRKGRGSFTVGGQCADQAAQRDEHAATHGNEKLRSAEEAIAEVSDGKGLRSELKIAADRISTLEKSLSAVRHEFAEQTPLSRHADSLASMMATSCEEKRAAVSGAEGEAQRSSDKVIDLQSRLDDAMEQVDALEDEKSALWDKISTLTEENSNMERKYTDLSNRCSKQTTTNNNLAKKNSDLAKENLQLRDEINDLNEDNDWLNTKVDNQREQLSNLYPIIKDLKLNRTKSKHWQVMSDNADLSEENDYLNTKIENQREQLHKLLPKMSDLKKQVRGWESRSASEPDYSDTMQAREVARLQSELKLRDDKIQTLSNTASIYAADAAKRGKAEAEKAAANRQRVNDLQKELEVHQKNTQVLEQVIAMHGRAIISAPTAMSSSAAPSVPVDEVNQIQGASLTAGGMNFTSLPPSFPAASPALSHVDLTSNAYIEPDNNQSTSEMGPLTFIDKRRMATAAASPSARPVVSPTLSLPIPATDAVRMTPVQRPLNHTTARPRGVREVPIAPSAIPRVTSGQHHTNGVAPPTPSPSQHSNVSRSPAAPVPVTTGTTHLTTPRPASSQPAPNQQVQRLESLLREKDVRINFLERQLRDARFGPTTRASKRGSPTAPASQAEADAVRRFYNEALKIAGQDFTACLECGVGFFAQFRGAPENPMERALILKCKKCDAEQCRWR